MKIDRLCLNLDLSSSAGALWDLAHRQIVFGLIVLGFRFSRNRLIFLESLYEEIRCPFEGISNFYFGHSNSKADRTHFKFVLPRRGSWPFGIVVEYNA